METHDTTKLSDRASALRTLMKCDQLLTKFKIGRRRDTSRQFANSRLTAAAILSNSNLSFPGLEDLGKKFCPVHDPHYYRSPDISQAEYRLRLSVDCKP